MVLAADGVVLDGGHGGLLGVDHLQVLDAALATLGAHDLGQRADRGLVDIRHLKAGGVHLIARAHGADDGYACLFGLDDEGDLARHRVDGVHDVIVLGEIELILRLRGEEGLVGGDPDVGVDVVDPLLGHIHFILPHGLAGGDDLAVEVGQADLIVVDEVQRAHAAAGQRLNGIAAHAADAEDGHPAVVQFFHCFLAQQHLGTGILILHSFSFFYLLALSVSALPLGELARSA